MRRSVITFTILALALLALTQSGQCAPGVRKDRKLIVIVAQGATLEDIAEEGLPNFRKLFKTGAGALMTTRTAGDSGGKLKSDTATEAACLTLGAGSRAVGGVEARRAYDYDEPVRDVTASALYKRLFLRDIPIGSIVMVTANEIRKNNAYLSYRLDIGAVGDTMRKAGLVTACIGNSDTPVGIHREAAAIAMDGAGIVDLGDVSRKFLRRNPDGPYGIETSRRGLMRDFDGVIGRANLVVIDTGDMARADWYGDRCFRPQAMAMRRWAVARADLVIGEILNRIDLRSSRVVFVSPGAPRWQPYSNRRLAPILIAGEGISRGLITSGSTRRPGLITNTDAAAGILDYFGLEVPSSVVGRPLGFKPSADPLSFLTAMDGDLTLQTDRLMLMRLMATLLTIVIILATLLRRWPALATRLALIPVMVVPLMALLPIFGSYNATLSGAILAGMAITAIFLVLLLRLRAGDALVGLCAALCLIVTIDLWRGGVLLANSPFSYSPAEGARFYGLGNEVSGSLVGAAIVVVLGLVGPLVGRVPGIRRLRTLICVGCFGALAVLAGAPNLGADTGGALAALAVAGASLSIMARGRMTSRRWLTAAIISLALFGAIVALDRLRGAGGETHLGRAFELVSGGRVAEFGMILVRKSSMNLRLLQSSAWSKLLLACLGGLLYLRATSVRTERPEWTMQAIKVIAVGAVAAFVVNDSGVVGAATCLIYAWSLEILAQDTSGQEHFRTG
jgi:hypothetical protein